MRNKLIVRARFAQDDNLNQCLISLDIDDVELIADLQKDLNKPEPWPYMVFMKSGTYFFVDLESGTKLEEKKWASVMRPGKERY